MCTSVQCVSCQQFWQQFSLYAFCPSNNIMLLFTVAILDSRNVSTFYLFHSDSTRSGDACDGVRIGSTASFNFSVTLMQCPFERQTVYVSRIIPPVGQPTNNSPNGVSAPPFQSSWLLSWHRESELSQKRYGGPARLRGHLQTTIFTLNIIVTAKILPPPP